MEEVDLTFKCFHNGSGCFYPLMSLVREQNLEYGRSQEIIIEGMNA